MDDLKLLEVCEKCGNNLTLMGSANMETGVSWAVKRCLSCGQHPVEEVVELAALRAYRPEPCEWCDKAKLPEGFDFDTHSHFVIGTDLYHHDSNCGWEGEEIRYCPNCGRPLGGDRK